MPRSLLIEFPQHDKSVEFVFRVAKGMYEIRVLAVGSRIRKNTSEGSDIHQLTQNYFVARADAEVTYVSTSLKDGA